MSKDTNKELHKNLKILQKKVNTDKKKTPSEKIKLSSSRFRKKKKIRIKNLSETNKGLQNMVKFNNPPLKKY